MKPRWFWRILILSLMAAVGAWCLWPEGETIPAIRGQRLARELGCFACHGPEGQGGVGDPAAPGGEIPDWSYTTARLFLSSEDDVRSWILRGWAAHEAGRDPAGRHTSVAPMPGYEAQLSTDDVDDLVAYFLAVSGWRESYSEDAYQGRLIAEHLGCFGCHGPSGIGGVPNPGSPEGEIPSLLGEDFDELVRDEAELRTWILDGEIERLRDRRSAGKIRMPAYHDFLSDIELDRLIAYLESLRSKTEKIEKANDAAEVIGAVIAPRTRPLPG